MGAMTREQVEQERRLLGQALNQVLDLVEYDETGRATSEYVFSAGALPAPGGPYDQMVVFEVVARVELPEPCSFDELMDRLRQRAEGRVSSSSVESSSKESSMPKPTAVREEFSVHRLNNEGLTKADVIATAFSRLLDHLEEVCGKEGREMALVRTLLQQCAFYAKRAMAVRPENQQAPASDG